MEIKDTFVHIFAIFTIEVAIYADCLHLVPPSYSCCGSVSSLTSSDSSMPNIQMSSPFVLNSETDPLVSGQKSFGQSMPPPFAAEDDTSAGYRSKAFGCSLLPCLPEEASAVCACNMNTGHVVTFKNSCDVQKHNCRFDTAFRVILNEVCPWEFESRRSNKPFEVDYSDRKYYNQ